MYWNLWICMLGGGILLILLALILTVVFKVPELLDDLSGRRLKRQVNRLKSIGNESEKAAPILEDYTFNVSKGLDDYDVSTTFMSDTEVRQLEEDLVTSYLEETGIVILEEQSSLFE